MWINGDKIWIKGHGQYICDLLAMFFCQIFSNLFLSFNRNFISDVIIQFTFGVSRVIMVSLHLLRFSDLKNKKMDNWGQKNYTHNCDIRNILAIFDRPIYCKAELLQVGIFFLIHFVTY